MSKSIIEIRGLCFSYNGNRVLENINLEVRERDFLLLLGPNGGGKTTLIKLILGFLEPDRGEILVFGQKTGKSGTKGVKIGYMPQYAEINRDYPITVMNTVLSGRLGVCSLWGTRYSEEDVKIARQALEWTKMAQYADKRIGELSGGQRQRVLIARALVSQPELLLLDEPVSNIDVQGKNELYELLAELNKKIAVIIVSHDATIIHSSIKAIACVNKTMHHHAVPELTPQMLRNIYGGESRHLCPVNLITSIDPYRKTDPSDQV